MNPADGPPVDFAEATEPMFVLLETGPDSGAYEVTDFLGSMMEMKLGANDQTPTARLSVNLGYDPRIVESDDTMPTDWQVQDYDGSIRNAWDAMLTGRRVMISTMRTFPSSDWLPFFGMLHKVEPGWSGASKGRPRWATAYATSIVEHGDKEPGQVLVGQWRRSRRAELGLRGQPGGGDTRRCVLVKASPVIFNPGGQPNCCKYPLEFGGEDVYVFADVEAPDAEHWTVARMLRYIEWAAMQPWPPMEGELYDVDHFSSLMGPTELQLNERWTVYGFLHDNLDKMIEDLLGTVYAVGSTPRERVLLRTLPDVAVDHMSTLEAFALLGDRAGVAYAVRHRFTWAGKAETLFYWSIRGDHGQCIGNRTIGGPPQPTEQHGPEGSAEPAPPEEPHPDSARCVYLYVPKDRYTAAGKDFYELMRDENVTEGGVVLDESPIRNEIRVQGDADQFEGAWELVPGWKPEDWLDVDLDDEEAVAEAVNRIGTPEFGLRYVIDQMTNANRVTYGHQLRRWALNEHGMYMYGDYQRANLHRPWDQVDDWRPYMFRTQGNLCTLANRGDNGCCLRRRRFLPPIAEWWAEDAVDPVELGVMVELSFDGGETWELHVTKIYSEPNECAITFTASDLTSIVGGNGISFVEAYITGVLRVRVLANVESDDAVVAVAGWRPESPLELIVTEHVSRRGQFRRHLRYSNQPGGLAANSVLPGYGVALPLNVDDGPEAERLATRLRNELEGRRIGGRVTIPYLLRDGGGPWEGYRIGDEVLGIITQDEGTFVPTLGSSDASKPGARIVGITYAYRDSPAERSTTLHIEDPGFEDIEHLPGDPRPRLTPESLGKLATAAIKDMF